MATEKETARNAVVCDRVWQRVAPELNPYPEARAAQAEERREKPGGAVEVQLAAFIEDALWQQGLYLTYVRRGPTTEARRRMQKLAGMCQERARRLMAVYFVRTGQAYCPKAGREKPQRDLSWRQALRLLCQEAESCARRCGCASHSVEDEGIQAIFDQLSRDWRRQAETVLMLLGQSLSR